VYEVGIDLFKEYSNPIDHFTEPPHLSLVLFMMRGDARLSVDAFQTHTLVGRRPTDDVFAHGMISISLRLTTANQNDP
jgi:hypothetical protein